MDHRAERGRSVVLYIAMSVDGYIAAPGDDLRFLSLVHQGNEDYGYAKMLASVDTIITGRRTYEWVMNEVGKYPNQDKKIYVLSSAFLPVQGNIEFYSGNASELVQRLKKESSDKDILCEGGAQLVLSLLKDGLIDEMILSVIPVLLGDGIRLFQRGAGYTEMRLIRSDSFESGLVQLHYKKV